MGFSVSGATVVLFLGIFISFGVAYSAANNGFDRVHTALEEDADGELTRQNTDLNVTKATRTTDADGNYYVIIKVANNGTSTLAVDDTDILIDGNYTKSTDMVVQEVDGNSDTNLWLPGETLRVKVSVSYDPQGSRVKVVTGPGVSDRTEVTA